MYRLMKSEKITLEHPISGSLSSYRQTQLGQFRGLGDALSACETANEELGFHHYILNASGKEYYGGTWID